MCLCVCACMCVCCTLKELSVRVLQSSAAGHCGCGSGELSNWSSNVSLTFSSSDCVLPYSLSHCFSLLAVFLLCLSSSVHSSSPLSVTLFFLTLSISLSFTLSQQEEGGVGGLPQSGNTLIIAFWSLWHGEVRQGKATHTTDSHSQTLRNSHRLRQTHKHRTHKNTRTKNHLQRDTHSIKKTHTERLTNTHSPNRNSCINTWWSREALRWKQTGLSDFLHSASIMCLSAYTQTHTM